MPIEKLRQVISSILVLLLILDLTTVNRGLIDLGNYFYIVAFLIQSVYLLRHFSHFLQICSNLSIKKQWGIILSTLSHALFLIVSLLDIGKL